MKKTKIIITTIILLLMVKINAQERNKDSNVNINFEHQNSEDLLYVLKSMNNSLDIHKIILNNVKGIYIRNINKNQVDLNNKNFTVSGVKVFQFDKEFKGNLEDYLILDCTIMYSVFEINIQFLNNYLEIKDKLTIKLTE